MGHKKVPGGPRCPSVHTRAHPTARQGEPRVHLGAHLREPRRAVYEQLSTMKATPRACM